MRGMTARSYLAGLDSLLSMHLVIQWIPTHSGDVLAPQSNWPPSTYPDPLLAPGEVCWHPRPLPPAGGVEGEQVAAAGQFLGHANTAAGYGNRYPSLTGRVGRCSGI